MDKLYASLTEQQAMMLQQKSSDDEAIFTRVVDTQSSCSSLPITPATENFGASAPTTRSASATPNESQVSPEEVLRLKLELAQAHNKISRLGQELEQTRSVTQDSGRATPGLCVEPEFPSTIGTSASPVAYRGQAGPSYGAATKVPFSRDNSWPVQEDARSETSDHSASGLNRARGIWGNSRPPLPNGIPSGVHQGPVVMTDGAQPTAWTNARPNVQTFEAQFVPSAVEVYRPERMAPDHEMMRPTGRRGGRYDGRFGAPGNYGGVYTSYGNGSTQYEPTPGYSSGPPASMPSGLGMPLYTPYQQQPVGTPLSPHATEFTSAAAPWKTEVCVAHGMTTLLPVS